MANMQRLPTQEEIEEEWYREDTAALEQDAMDLEQYQREEDNVSRCDSVQVPYRNSQIYMHQDDDMYMSNGFEWSPSIQPVRTEAECTADPQTVPTPINKETPVRKPLVKKKTPGKAVNKLWVAAGVAVLFAAYQVYNLYNNFRMWMSSGTTRAQDDDPTGNPQCHSVIAAETFHPIAMLVTLLLNVGLHYWLRKPSDEELSRKLQSTESEVRKLRSADRVNLTEQKQAVDEAIKQTTEMWQTRCNQLTRKHEAEIEKLKAEIEGLKKPESPAEKAQMLDACTETDADTNDDWHHQAQQAKAVIEKLKAEIKTLKARFRTDICHNMGLADAPAEADEVQEETADEKLKREVAAACAGPGA